MHGGESRRLFRGGGGDRHAGAARRGDAAARASGETSQAIRQLLALAPNTALRVEADGSEDEVPLERRQGRRPAARAAGREDPGGRRPRWKARRTSTSRCSPASRCRSTKKPGDRVTGATINGNGTLVIRAERVGADTLLARIVHMVARGAAHPCAGAAPRRPGRRLLRAGRDRRSPWSPPSPGGSSVRSRGWPMRWSTPWRC